VRVVCYRPTNSWLRRQLDTRWQQWLTRCTAGALIVGALLAAFVAPRQATLQARYQIAKLSEELVSLEVEVRQLEFERESLTSPAVLAAQLPELGLAPVAWENVAHMTPVGTLIFPAPSATPTSPVSKVGKTR